MRLIIKDGPIHSDARLVIFDRRIAVIAERLGHRGLTRSRLSRHVALVVSKILFT